MAGKKMRLEKRRTGKKGFGPLHGFIFPSFPHFPRTLRDDDVKNMRRRLEGWGEELTGGNQRPLGPFPPLDGCGMGLCRRVKNAENQQKEKAMRMGFGAIIGGEEIGKGSRIIGLKLYKTF